MPAYIVMSEAPIKVREVERPDRPDWTPEHPWVPGGEGIWGPGGRPGQGLPPSLPPRDEWPPLPPFLHPGVGLPIPPTPEHPMVPIPDEETDPPGIWPPVKPDFPDLSGKTLALALVYVSRHVAKWHWIIIDHEQVKEKAKAAFEAVKDKLPAGGVGGTPPQRPVPGPQHR